MLMRWAVALCLMAAPVAAECVDFDSFAKGVRVTQADGSEWTVRRGAHEVIRMDQDNPTGVYAKYVIAAYGVYATEGTRNGIGVTSEYKLAKTPPQPSDAMDWSSNYKVNWIPYYDKSRQDWRAGKMRVTAGDLRDVKIGGCPYRVMAVDVAETANDRTTVVHFAYFPDLRFGTQTRITYDDGRKKEVGIKGMVPLK